MNPNPPAAAFYVTSGTIPLGAASYLEREADQQLLQALRAGEYCFVLNARQMGKSSLSLHTTGRLEEQGIKTVFLDLTKIGGQNVTPEQWYIGLLAEVGRALGLRREVLTYWKEHDEFSLVQRFFGALREVALEQLDVPIVIFVDEIDATRSLTFATDEFFAAVRQFYNHRGQDPVYGRLTFCLVGSATPSDLIEDRRTSPFNIGQQIELRDFTEDEVQPLAEGLDRPNAEALLKRVFYWTNGHPYLTQTLCAEIARDPEIQTVRQVDGLVDRFFFEAQARERNVNLADVSNRILQGHAKSEEAEEHRAAILDLYARVFHPRVKVQDDETNRLVSVLKLSGITRTVGGELQVRNRIYQRVFDRKWVTDNLPDSEARRQKAAYRRGMLRTGAVAAVVLAVVGGSALTAFVQFRRAEHQAQLVEERDEEKRQALVRLNVAYGVQMLDQEKPFHSLLWFAEALGLERGDAAREEMHHTRLTSGLQSVPRLLQIFFHQGRIRHAAFSPDGSRIVTASGDHTAQVWDAVTGEPLLPQPLQHREPLWCIHFSPDGSQIITASHDQTACLWDATSGQRLQTWEHEGGVTYAVFSPDGKWVVTATLKGIAWVWDTTTDHPPIKLKHGGKLFCVNFSPDGRRVVTAGVDNRAKVWDLLSEEVLRTLEHSGEIGSAEFSPDGEWVVTSGSHGVQIWNAATGKSAFTPIRLQGFVMRAAFSPDGTQMVTASTDKTARVWDVKTGEPLTPPLPHGGRVDSAFFGPNGRRLITASNDGTARVWDLVGNPSQIIYLPNSGSIYTADFDPKGKYVATGGENGLSQVWKVDTGQPVTPPLRHQEKVWSVVFSRDEKQAVTASGDYTAWVWDLETGQPVTPPLQHEDVVFSADFNSSDGRWVVTASGDHTARVWKVETGEELFFVQHGDEVFKAFFSPDGDRIVTASMDKTAQIWDWRRKKPIANLEHEDWVWAAEFSPDGKKVVTGSFDGKGDVWDAHVGTHLAGSWSHQGNVINVHFCPKGERVVTASWDHTARVWDATTGEPLTGPLPHQGLVLDAFFSPNGERVLTRSWDGTARVWDAYTGQPFTAPLRHTGFPAGASFSQDGNQVFTLDSEGMVRIWPIVTEKRSVEEWRDLAQLLSGGCLDKQGAFEPLRIDERQQLWVTLKEREKAKGPDSLFAPPTGEEVQAWHRRQATIRVERGQWDAALWHLVRWSPEPSDKAAWEELRTQALKGQK